MTEQIYQRVIGLAYYILDCKCTIRQVAKVFGISKSTVHNDLSRRLEKISPNLFEKVCLLLDNNFKIKHIRGGEATKAKYLHKREVNEKICFGTYKSSKKV